MLFNKNDGCLNTSEQQNFKIPNLLFRVFSFPNNLFYLKPGK